MQRRYIKIVKLFSMIFVISLASFFAISNIGHEEWKRVTQSKNMESDIIIEEIHTIEDYLQFVENVNSGNDYQSIQVQLCSDLDFSECGNICPMGTAGKDGHSFRGVFNGNGHTISGVTMDYPEDYAGLFVNLGGIVKNLQVKDCTFSGRVCGIVATDTIEAAVLNCYADVQTFGEISGTFVGILNGKLRNCVSLEEVFVGGIEEGETELCYQRDYAEFSELNKNLAHLSGYYRDTDFCIWEESGLSTNKADLLECLTARLNVKGVELKFSGYYSRNRKSWCFTLPATYGDEAVLLEAKTSQGRTQNFNRNPEKELMTFIWEDRYYPIDFLCDDSTVSVYVTLQKQKDLDYVHKHKEEKIPGILMVIDEDGQTSYAEIKGFYGHGNDSWLSEKKSYNLKFESYVDLLDMGANEDFAFLAGYRNSSLMSYIATYELMKELGYAYALDYRLVNLYVAGDYAGVYFLVEKVELDKNRIEIESVYEHARTDNTARLDTFEYCSWKDEAGIAERYFYNIDENPEDITGGYLLEADGVDYSPDDSRFVSDRGLGLTLKRTKYSSKEQVDYIADYWQEFEDALFAEDGYNKLGKHYSDYIDIESFAMQWLYFAFSQDVSLSSSIYFYKESDITGDGLMHACYPWDVEHSYVWKKLSEELWLPGRTGFKGYWQEIFKHKDFQDILCKVWNEKYIPAIKKMISGEPTEYESGMKNLKWYQDYIVGIHYLENSRWENLYLWNRCGEIREFMEVRMKILTKCLNNPIENIVVN